jgi:hypothetical protein
VERAVNSVGLNWLRKKPAVPVSDNTRLTVIERLRGMYKSKKIQDGRRRRCFWVHRAAPSRKPVGLLRIY